MRIMGKSQLKTLREGLRPKVSQEDVARRANITLATYRNAESGKRVQYSTATAILGALNAILNEHKKNSISLDDLGLMIE